MYMYAKEDDCSPQSQTWLVEICHTEGSLKQVHYWPLSEKGWGFFHVEPVHL